MCRAMFLELLAGPHPHRVIRLILRVTEERWEQGAGHFGYSDIAPVRSWTERKLRGQDGFWAMPTVHFCMGGVVIDSWGRPRAAALAIGERRGPMRDLALSLARKSYKEFADAAGSSPGVRISE